MALLVSSTMAWADGQWTSGDCTVTYNNGTLTVSGQGAMEDYEYGQIPWSFYKNDINALVIEDGVTRIGDYVFCKFEYIPSISIPKSVTSISPSAFNECPAVTSITVASENTVYHSPNSCNAIIEKSTNTLVVGCKNTVIPEDVTTIGERAFDGCSTLTSITLPNSITKIGESAFAECEGLTSIVIVEGVEVIEKYTFSYCDKLESVTFPNSLTTIKKYAFEDSYKLASVNIPKNVSIIEPRSFSGCSGLTSITVDSENSVLYSPNDCNAVIEKSTKKLILGCKNTVIPNDVTELEEGAFISCQFTTIGIPNSVTKIGNQTFWQCDKLTSIELPNSVTTLDHGAFDRCTALTSIVIPSSVKSMGSQVFNQCSNLQTATCLAVTPPDCSSPFYGCNNLNFIYVPGGSVDAYKSKWSDYESKITSLGTWNADSKTLYITDASTAATNISTNKSECKHLIIADGVEMSIPDNAFKGETNLSSVTIGSGVSSIGASAFEGCTGIGSIIIPASVQSIGASAFNSCSNLTTVTCGASTPPSLGSDAFSDCTRLTDIYVPGGSYDAYKSSWSAYESKIRPSNAWDSTSKTLSIYIASSAAEFISNYKSECINLFIADDVVMSIDNNAFEDCTALKTVTIGSGVTSIGYSAFEGCTALETVTIGNGVTSVGYEAFEYCSALATVTIGSGVTDIGDDAFYGCKMLKSKFINNSSLDAEEHEYWGATIYDSYVNGLHIKGTKVIGADKNITTAEIPEGITSIEDEAFRLCTSLTSITIPSSVTSIGELAFVGCENLATVNIPSDSQLASIGQAAFGIIGDSYAPAIPWLTNQPDGLVYVGKVVYAYKGTMPENTSITLNEDTKGIAGLAFAMQMNLISITIPKGVESIGYGAIAMTGITSVTIPSSVTSIGDIAFAYCSNLTSVTIESTTPPNFGEAVFYDCSSLATIYVPMASLETYQAAANWSEYENKMIGCWFLNIAPSEYATFYSDQKANFISDNATNAEVSTITAMDGSTATTAVIEGVVPAEMPVLVKNTATTEQTFILIPTSDAATTNVTNASQFRGSATATTLTGENYYVCNGQEFIWVKGSIDIAANRCWLDMSATPANTRGISIGTGGDTTGIDSMTADGAEGEWYDLSGRKLAGKPLTKGVYIHQGKKVVIK